MFGQRALDLFKVFVPRRPVHLVRLGHHHLKSHGGAVQKVHDFLVHRFDPVAGVDQHEGPAQGLAALQILLQQRLPFGHHRHRRLGIAVTGQVDEKSGLSQGKVVDFLGAARRVRRTGERLSVGQSIDQAGFTNVRSTGKANLQPVSGRQARHGDHAFDEVHGAGEHQPPGLAVGQFGFGGVGELQAHASLQSSPIAIVPPCRTLA